MTRLNRTYSIEVHSHERLSSLGTAFSAVTNILPTDPNDPNQCAELQMCEQVLACSILPICLLLSARFVRALSSIFQF